MREDDRPEDLAGAIAFHGHECGGLLTGYRAAKAAMEWLGVARAEDEELVAVVETDSCAADAVQTLTGCTFGKGNLVFQDYGKMAVTLWSRSKGRGVRVSRRASTRGASAQDILAADAADLFELRRATGTIPEKARVHESQGCARCGEAVMLTRLVETDQGALCIPCARKVSRPAAGQAAAEELKRRSQAPGGE